MFVIAFVHGQWVCECVSVCVLDANGPIHCPKYVSLGCKVSVNVTSPKDCCLSNFNSGSTYSKVFSLCNTCKEISNFNSNSSSTPQLRLWQVQSTVVEVEAWTKKWKQIVKIVKCKCKAFAIGNVRLLACRKNDEKCNLQFMVITHVTIQQNKWPNNNWLFLFAARKT